jgi:hypothetical protein
MDMLSDKSKIGSFICPHQDGDFTLTVYDLLHWSTGSCLIRQEGQGQIQDLVLTAQECKKLSNILGKFTNQYTE